MKILVIRFSSIGDIVLTTPVFRCMKMQMPTAEIHFLTKLSFKAVTEHNPYIHQFHYFNGNFAETISTLKKQQFDVVIDLHKNFRTFRIKQALKAPAYTYQKLSWQKFLLTRLGLNFMPNKHITQRCLDTIAPLGFKDDGKGLDYFITEKDKVQQQDLPIGHRFGFIAIVIGASYYTKKLPVVKLQALCNAINHPIVLVGGKEDTAEGAAIASINPDKIYNACGKFSLHESASIVQQSKLVIAHDTGLLYVACAFHKPVLAIWGGTSPKLGVEPYYGSSLQGGKYTNFIVPNLGCQPCSNFGTKTCPKGHFKCMNNQDVDTIVATAMSLL